MEKSLLKNAAVLKETKNQRTKEGTLRKKWTKARVGKPRVKIIFEFTKQEEQIEIDSERLATPRVKAEDHKGCDEETGEMLRNIFNEMIKHRPVCTLSTLCKEFSTPGSATDKQIPALRPSRIPTLLSNPGSLGDIHTARTEKQRMGYQHVVATVDFEKAFDTKHNDAIWKALSRFEIDTPHINFMKKLYSHWRVYVRTDTESDELKIERGRNRETP